MEYGWLKNLWGESRMDVGAQGHMIITGTQHQRT